MKKIFTLMLLSFVVAGIVKAEEYVAFQPTSPVTVDWSNGGNQPSYAGSYFTVSNGDVIKVHITNVSSSNYQPKLIWKGATGSDWNQLDVVTTTDGVFSYTISSEEIATSINTYGIALSGIGYKMLDICVETNNASSASQSYISDASTDLGNWGTGISLSNFDFSKAKIGDVIALTWTSYNTTLSGDTWATIQIQGSSNTKITDACSVGTQNSNLQTITNITIDNSILTELQNGTAKIKGGNVYLNALSITSDNKVRQQSLSTTETYFGNWAGNLTVSATQATPLQVGDVLNVAYDFPENYSGYILIREASGEWSEIQRISNLTGTGTAHFIVTESLLTKFQNGNVNITGYGGENATTSDGGKWTSISFTHFVNTPGYRPVYIPDGGYATFCGTSTCALPENVTAYYVSAVSDNSATLTSISNIPANQGVILKGAKGIYQLYTTTDDAASVTDNKLVGVTTRSQITETDNKYVLYDNNGSTEFRKITANTYLDAYKCYLSTASSGNAPSLNIVLGGSATTIDTPKTVVKTDDRIYTLSGQEVKTPTRGIYIRNGKKYIIK